MIIEFSAENFRSLRDRCVLSFERVPRLREEILSFPISPLGVDVVPVAAIYGPNGSGKTNVLLALRHMLALVAGSYQSKPEDKIPFEPFRLTDNIKSRSCFEVVFQMHGDVYKYKIAHNDSMFINEALYQKGKKAWRRVFRRNGQDFSFGTTLKGQNKTISGITKKNSLFLSAAANNNHGFLSDVYLFLMNHFRGSYSDALIHGNANEQDSYAALEENHQKVLGFMRSADLGIQDYEVKTKRREEKEVDQFLSVMTAISSTFDNELPIEDVREDFSKFYIKNFLMHGEGGKTYKLPFDVQSDGTRALWSRAAMIIDALENGGLVIFDELEKSLHPLVARSVLKRFLDPNYNTKGAQIVFTSHSLALLETDGLPRSSIWICEKSSEGFTEFYPLSDFKTRSRDDIARAYLEGRFGGIPFVD